MDEQSITAGLLERLMSAISEEYWCAGWMHNLEYTLWDVVTGRRAGICSPEEIEQLKYLSEKCGGWIIWDEQAKGTVTSDVKKQSQHDLICHALVLSS